MTDPTPSVSALLPLPTCWTFEHPVRLYTADQMHAYARAHIDTLQRELAEYRELEAMYVQQGLNMHATMQRAEAAESALADARRDAERYAFIRDIACCSMSLSRNDGHAPNYMTAADWIEAFPENYDEVLPAEIEAMKAANTIWTLQIYPNTPVGFNWYHAATLDAAIDAAIDAAMGATHEG